MNECDFEFACPRCSIPLSSELKCAHCGTDFEIQGGIYRFLLPERCKEIQPFLNQYRLVRERDGYRSYTKEQYHRLPDIQTGNPQAEVWKVRRESFGRLLSLLDGQFLAILDLGAGNGWLSYRLAELGHCLATVDWLDDENDGLRVHRHYPVQFTCVQADFDALPFSDHQFDIVIFNASLHYSPDIRRTLCKAREMLKPEGQIFVMDSPTFHSDESGQMMLREQNDRLHNNYGLREVIQLGIGYLTVKNLVELGEILGIAFQFHQSHGAPLWPMKRWWAGVRRGREPAAFGVWAGRLL